MDFSADGFMLASIGLDDNHTITIHNWKSGNLLASVGGHKDRIFMIRWNPFNPSQLVTVGVKHIKFWTRVGKSMESKRGILPKDKKNTTILAITFSHAEPQDSEKFLFTGGSDGNMLYFNCFSKSLFSFLCKAYFIYSRKFPNISWSLYYMKSNFAGISWHLSFHIQTCR